MSWTRHVVKAKVKDDGGKGEHGGEGMTREAKQFSRATKMIEVAPKTGAGDSSTDLDEEGPNGA